MGTLHEDVYTFMTVSRWILLRIRNVSDKSSTENQNTHFIFSNFFQKSCRLWDNVEKYGGAREAADDNTAACCMLIIKATRGRAHAHAHAPTHARGNMNTYCLSNATVVTRTCLSVTLHVHCLSYSTNPWAQRLICPTLALRPGFLHVQPLTKRNFHFLTTVQLATS